MLKLFSQATMQISAIHITLSFLLLKGSLIFCVRSLSYLP